MIGSAIDDEDIDRLYRDLNEKWIISAPPREALDEADRAMAAKLLSKGDMERFGALKTGERFRPTPRRARSTSKVQFFYVPAKEGTYSDYVGWSIDVFQGARKRNLYHSLSDAKAAFCLSKLVEMGHSVEILITEAMKRAGITTPPKPGAWSDAPVVKARVASNCASPPRPMARPQQGCSQRFAMMEELRGFKR